MRTAVAVLVLATLAQVRADGLGAEFRISPEGTFPLIESPVLAMTPAGDFVAVWSTGTVLAQRYNSSGGAVGGVIRADETYPGVSPRPDVAVALDRSFVVVWEAYVDATNTTAILGRRFDAAGLPLGAPFQVSTQPQLNHVTAAAAMDGDGSFIVAWAAHDPNGGVTVLTRRFAPSGEPVTGELVIGSLSFDYAKPTPDVVFGDAGTALVAWKDESEAINLSSVAAGGAVSTVALTTTSAPRQTPRIAKTDEGFVAAWLSYSSSYAGTFDVIARRFAANGVPLADESQVNVTTRVRGYDEIGPSLALASSPASGWVLAWRVARLDTTDSEIGARAYAADGSPLGDEFRVDTGESSKHPAAGMAADGDYTLAYLVEDAYANPVGVYGRRWNDDPPADLAVAVTESSDPVHWNSGVEYRIRVDNLTLPGPDSTGVSVAITVNGGDVEQAGGTDWFCTGSSPLLDCHLQGPLPAGAQAGDLALLVRAPGMSTTMTVEASVVAEQADPELANNTAAESTTVADLEPDPFYFAPRDGVEPGSEQTSDAVTISGLEAPAPIAVYGGFYSINGGPFTDVTGVIGPGDQVQLRHTAATEPGASQSTMLRINYSYGWFQTSTVGDATPDPFSFPDRTGVAPSAEQVSDPVTITGLTVGASIRADLGPENSEYSIDDGPFTSEQRLIYDGQTVRVRHTSAACGNCLSETRLWIGDVAGTFRSYTQAPDTTPDQVAFPDRLDVLRGTEVISEAMVITGITDDTPIRIQWSYNADAYSIDGGPFTAEPGLIRSGQSLRVRHTSSQYFSSDVRTDLIFGSQNGPSGGTETLVTFRSRTQDQDAAPDQTVFPDTLDVLRRTEVISEPMVITGITDDTPIRIPWAYDNSDAYSIDGGPFTAEPGLIRSGQSLRVRHISSQYFSSDVRTDLIFGSQNGPSGSTETLVTFRSRTQDQDATPDQVAFPDQLDVLRSTEVISEAMVITGITDDTPIRVQWAYTNSDAYSIDGGPFTAEPGLIRSGQSLRVRHTSSQYFSSDVRTDLIFGSQNGPSGGTETLVTFRSRTQDQDATPDQVAFPDQLDVLRSTEVTSESMVITGITDDTPIRIPWAYDNSDAYSIDGGPFTAEPGLIRSGQSLRVRHTSSQYFSSDVRTDLIFGSQNGPSGSTETLVTFRSRTQDQDTVPDPVSFPDRSDVPRNTEVISDPVLITGVTDDTAVSIGYGGGEYSIDDGPFTAEPGLIRSGQSLRVRHTSSQYFSTETRTDVLFGSGASFLTFRSHTRAQDTTPDPFSFGVRDGVARNTTVVSDTVMIAGIDEEVAISVAGGEYSIDGAPFTSSPSLVDGGQSVRVQHVSSSAFGGSVETTLTIGTASTTFRSTTQAQDVAPDPFAFASRSDVEPGSEQVSDAVTILGITDDTPVAVTGGEYSIGGAPFTAAPATIANGQSVRVRHAAAAEFGSSVTTTLAVGDGTGSFTTTTRAGDGTPDAFTFTDLSGQEPDTDVISNEVLVAGIEIPVAIDVAGGLYSIDGGAFTGAPGTVANGQRVRLQQRTAAGYEATTGTTLNIGGVADTFTTTTRAGDACPDPYDFLDQTGVPLDTLITSDPVTVTGIEVPVDVVTTVGTTFSIDGGPFGESGAITSGQTLRLQHHSSPMPKRTTFSSVMIGCQGASWGTETAYDEVPDPFGFATQAGVPRTVLVTSEEVVIGGFDTAVSATATGGSFSVNGGPWLGGNQTVGVGPGDRVRVQHLSSPEFDDTRTTQLTLGTVTGAFTSRTVARDTTPDPFTFADPTGVERGTTQTSNAIVVSSINSAAQISVSGGSYSVDGGTFTTAAGTVVSGASVRVRHVSSPAFSTSVTTTLTIGGVAESFVTTSVAQDVTPDPFAFASRTGVARTTAVVSDAVTIAGINDASPIGVTSGAYSVNGAAFTTASGTVVAGDSVRVQHTSSSVFSGSVTTTLVVGGVSGQFTSTTLARDVSPDAFAFVDVTNVARSTTQTSGEVTITDINDAAPISVSGGKYSIDGGPFKASAGTIASGQKVRVRHTSSASFATSVNTVLTVGGVSDTFTSTTEARDTTPNAFGFASKDNVAVNTMTESDDVAVGGINDAAPISISGGEYSVNGGVFTPTVGTVGPNEVLRVRHASAATFSTSRQTILTIGGVSGTFASTTETEDTTPDAFSFEDRTGVLPVQPITSNAVTIVGINAPTGITLTGADGAWSVNGEAFTSAAGMLRAGDRVTLRVTSAAAPQATVEVIVTIGGVMDRWTVRTLL